MAMQSFASRRRLDRVVRELEKMAYVTVEHDLVILSLVGTEMRNCIGIAGKMFGTLSDGSVNIRYVLYDICDGRRE
jgi:aspartate kinase